MKKLKEICNVTLEACNKIELITSFVSIAAGITLLVLPESKEKDEKED